MKRDFIYKEIEPHYFVLFYKGKELPKPKDEKGVDIHDGYAIVEETWQLPLSKLTIRYIDFFHRKYTGEYVTTGLTEAWEIHMLNGEVIPCKIYFYLHNARAKKLDDFLKCIYYKEEYSHYFIVERGSGNNGYPATAPCGEFAYRFWKEYKKEPFRFWLDSNKRNNRINEHLYNIDGNGLHFANLREKDIANLGYDTTSNVIINGETDNPIIVCYSGFHGKSYSIGTNIHTYRWCFRAYRLKDFLSLIEYRGLEWEDEEYYHPREILVSLFNYFVSSYRAKGVKIAKSKTLEIEKKFGLRRDSYTNESLQSGLIDLLNLIVFCESKLLT